MQTVTQDGALAHHLKVVHDVPKDPDGHVVICAQDSDF